ncbi:MAG: hypothetical protein ACKOJF_27690, partial [Planctomycetaceae bacterium]
MSAGDRVEQVYHGIVGDLEARRFPSRSGRMNDAGWVIGCSRRVGESRWAGRAFRGAFLRSAT